MIRELLIEAATLRELLINAQCPCGGWTCPRCVVTVEEARALVPDLRDNIDREREQEG